MSLDFEDWGEINYQAALDRQLELVESVASTQSPGTVVFCSHPPVVTTGRKTQVGDLFDWHGEVIEISRGGRATYHGPSQLVVYPIINLTLKGQFRPIRDLTWFLRSLEDTIVETLVAYDIQAQGKSATNLDQNTPPSQSKELDLEETGVWVKHRKIASLGIAVRKWVTFHGAAINLDQDEQAFQGLKPCGFSSSVMLSLQEATGKQVDREVFKQSLKQKIFNRFG